MARGAAATAAHRTGSWHRLQDPWGAVARPGLRPSRAGTGFPTRPAGRGGNRAHRHPAGSGSAQVRRAGSVSNRAGWCRRDPILLRDDHPGSAAAARQAPRQGAGRRGSTAPRSTPEARCRAGRGHSDRSAAAPQASTAAAGPWARPPTRKHRGPRRDLPAGGRRTDANPAPAGWRWTVLDPRSEDPGMTRGQNRDSGVRTGRVVPQRADPGRPAVVPHPCRRAGCQPRRGPAAGPRSLSSLTLQKVEWFGITQAHRNPKMQDAHRNRNRSLTFRRLNRPR